jgi:hypothetical protein
MKLFRYRAPSLRTIVGITRVTRAVRKASGISTIQRYTKPGRMKQRFLQKIGVYGNPTVTSVRQAAKGNMPSPLGLWSKIKFW